MKNSDRLRGVLLSVNIHLVAVIGAFSWVSFVDRDPVDRVALGPPVEIRVETPKKMFIPKYQSILGMPNPMGKKRLKPHG